MTTDITELAQSLKNAAEKAQIEEGPTWFSEEQLSHEDGLSLHKADAEFISLANPANILALVEALEKVQRANGYLREQSAEWERKAISNFQECARMSERIYLLESRTVTVKLPDYRNTYKSPLADEVEHQVRLALELFSSSAGIKVEAE